MSDVPYGVLLSGGLDSSVISAIVFTGSGVPLAIWLILVCSSAMLWLLALTPLTLSSMPFSILFRFVALRAVVLAGRFSAYVTASFTTRIRADLFAKVQTFSDLDYQRFNRETLLTRATSDTTQMQMVVINMLRILAAEGEDPGEE